MDLLPRFDLVARLDFAPGPPRPGVARATKTPEGYLVVKALLARDGVLTYSDGRNSWIEYRSRDELERAAKSWEHRPITDEHPKRMVDASTYADVARGHVMSAELLPPDAHGVSYLQGDVLIADKALVEEVEKQDGKREVSIGFLARTHVQDGVAPDGTAYQARQIDLQGNHVAVVRRGRAGPAVRLMLDSESGTVSTPFAMAMSQPDSLDFRVARTDNIGAPQTMGTAIGPDGETVQAPMWLLELAKLGMEAQAAQGEPPPEDPMIDVSQKAPAAPMEEPEQPAPPSQDAMMPDKEERKESAADVVRSLKQMRKLERIALRVGVPEERLDSADSPADVGREILAKLSPKLDTKDMTELELATAVKTVMALRQSQESGPAPEQPRTDSPWNVVDPPKGPAPKAEPKKDAALERVARALAAEDKVAS